MKSILSLLLCCPGFTAVSQWHPIDFFVTKNESPYNIDGGTLGNEASLFPHPVSNQLEFSQPLSATGSDIYGREVKRFENYREPAISLCRKGLYPLCTGVGAFLKFFEL